MLQQIQIRRHHHRTEQEPVGTLPVVTDGNNPELDQQVEDILHEIEQALGELVIGAQE